MTVDPPRAGLDRLVALVPVALLEGAKSRLGDRLDPEERQALVLGLLERTVAAADDVAAIASVVVVSPDPAVLRVATAQGATPVLQADRGLNEGLTAAARWAAADGATAVLVIASDLPAISAPTLDAVVHAAAGRLDPGRPLVAIVADRHGRGTNALLVSPPDAIPFQFGADSRAGHRDAAAAVGAVLVELDGPLSLDLDLPADLIMAEELGLLDPAHVG